MLPKKEAFTLQGDALWSTKGNEDGPWLQSHHTYADVFKATLINVYLQFPRFAVVPNIRQDDPRSQVSPQMTSLG